MKQKTILGIPEDFAPYRYAPHNDVSVKEEPHVRRWSHIIRHHRVTILKIYNTLVLPVWVRKLDSEIALQRRRNEAAEMKLFRPLAGYSLYDHKTNGSVRR
jgi:hypothetical protein